MDNLSDIRTAVRSDLNVSATSSLFPTATIDLAINRSYRKASTLFRWPNLEDAKKTSTAVNKEYYDTPKVFTPDSIWKLEVDGNMYGEEPDGSPMAFSDYLLWKDNNPNSTEKKWAKYKNQYFIYPTPTTVGNYNICVWGLKIITELSADADETIFTNGLQECNEALVLEATAILKKKGEEHKNSVFYSDEAKQILVVAYRKIAQEQAKYEKTQPFLNVPDYYGKAVVENTIGNF